MVDKLKINKIKIFLSVLEEINSDGEDPDLQSEEIYFDNAKSLEYFYQNSIFKTICFFVKNGSVKNFTRK